MVPFLYAAVANFGGKKLMIIFGEKRSKNNIEGKKKQKKLHRIRQLQDFLVKHSFEL